MAKFGGQTRMEISALIEEILRDEEKTLNLAFLKAGEDPLAISFNIRVDVGDNGDNEVDVTYTYTVEKRKGKASGRANENGENLFTREELRGKGSPEQIRDRKGIVGRPPGFRPLGG